MYISISVSQEVLVSCIYDLHVFKLVVFSLTMIKWVNISWKYAWQRLVDILGVGEFLKKTITFAFNGLDKIPFMLSLKHANQPSPHNELVAVLVCQTRLVCHTQLLSCIKKVKVKRGRVVFTPVFTSRSQPSPAFKMAAKYPMFLIFYGKMRIGHMTLTFDGMYGILPDAQTPYY